jgi:phthiocerol/phenolphthiocerol synthesis type-I polyketide synthase E
MTTGVMEGIAIIGWSGRFPGADDIEQLWANLRRGTESISFFTRDELLAAGVDPALLANPHYVPAAAVLDDIESFDAAFFGYNPREAEVMDPQQRIFLETAWSALEHAAYEPRLFGGRIGVYAGAGMNTYLLNNLMTHPDLLERIGPYQAVIGSDKDFLATRVSYKLNLRGPSVTVQTACSTSLVAVAMACQSLMNAECDMALAGGVTIRVPQRSGYLYQEEGILSPDGHCRPFDAQARGTVPGSGVAVVVLKRLADGIADGDTIHAVIRGWAINNDGSQKAGYTAPSVEGQSEAIVEAMALAGIEPEAIGYVEAHGTGTPLGDPIEIAALTRAYRSRTQKQSFCAIGSVKSNFGHLDGAAGATGLIKAALAAQKGEIPPSLHFQIPNPEIRLESSPFYINGSLRPWRREGAPRRAAVSSFGIGGTNAHVVLEEPPAPVESDLAPSHALIVLSAKTETALDRLTERLGESLQRNPEASLQDIGFTLQVGRASFDHRRFFVWSDTAEALQDLQSGVRGRSALVPETRPPLAFLFPGQGAQYAAMGADLYQALPIFREEMDRCLEILTRLGVDLRPVLFPAAGEMARAHQQLEQTALTQPALFATEYALAKLWIALGIQPEAMLGHSVGEYVAACLSGVFSLEDALRLIAIRGRLIQQVAPGAMLGVPLPESEVTSILSDSLSIAAVNAPALCTVSGPTEEVEKLERHLDSRAVTTRRLHTSHAFHSSMMDGVLGLFREELARTTLRAPRIPFVSNVTGTWITAEEARDTEYWVSHVRRPVRFADGVATLLENPKRLLLEVGPGQSLGSLARQQSSGRGRAVVSSMRHPQEDTSDLKIFLHGVGSLWLNGVVPDWPTLHRSYRRRRVPLPTYPFERVRYWIEPEREARPRRRAIYKRPDIREWFYTPSWRRTAPVVDTKGARAPRYPVITDPADLETLSEVPATLVFVAGSRGVEKLLALIGGLAHRARGAAVQLAVVTTGLRDVIGTEEIESEEAAIFGLCKVISQEYPNIHCRSFDLEHGDEREMELVFHEVAASGREPVLAFRGGHRWAPSFEPLPLDAPDGDAVSARHVLITGAAGRFGLAAAEHFARTRQAALTLVDLRTPDPEKVAEIETLARGLIVAQADVVDRTTMERVLDEARSRFGPIDIVIHAAGVIDDGDYRTLGEVTPAEFQRHLVPKLGGVRVLDELLRDTKPRICVITSSLASVLGGITLAPLAAADAAVDAFAQHARDLPWMCINFEAWQQVANTETPVGRQQSDLMLSMPEALDALERAIAIAGLSQVVVSTGDLDARLAQWSNVLDKAATVRTAAAPRSHSFRPPTTPIETRAATVWQEALGVEAIGLDDDFFELGGNSLVGLQILSRLRGEFQVDLPLRTFFEARTVEGMARAIEAERSLDAGELAKMEAILDEIESLSNEEIEARLGDDAAGRPEDVEAR